MRVGVYFKDAHIENENYKYPEKGNPGTGGTQYCFLMLMRYLKLMYNDVEIVCYHLHPQHFPDGVIGELVEDEEALFERDMQDIDVFLYRCNGGDSEWYRQLREKNVTAIAWAHNDLTVEEIDLLLMTPCVKRVVCVGKQQYDTLLDHKIRKKLTYIYNMFECNRPEYYREEELGYTVTYVGSMIKAKGFHVLAKAWRKVLKKVPDAELYVIGNSQVYDDLSSSVSEYERECVKLLSDDNGRVFSSVHFCGKLGIEKAEIYQKTRVGIANPTAVTETFCISAVEMEACGIPIVAKAEGGLLDTVVNKRTGLLFSHGEKEFVNCIVRLLQDDALNKKLGNEAKRYVEKFSPQHIVPQWYVLFNDVLLGKPCFQEKATNFYFKNLKWLRILNKSGVSIMQMKAGMATLFRRMKSRINRLVNH